MRVEVSPKKIVFSLGVYIEPSQSDSLNTYKPKKKSYTNKNPKVPKKDT